MVDSNDDHPGPWRLDLLQPSPVNTAMLRACEANPTGPIATTIPLGELRKFCEAFLNAYGVSAPPPQTNSAHTLVNTGLEGGE